MTDIDIIERVARYFGVKYCAVTPRKSHHKRSYRVQVRGGTAVKWMRRLYGWMGKRRRQQIDKAIASLVLKGPYHKISIDLVQHIQNRRRGGERVEDLAVEYGVSIWTIYNLKSRKR